MTGYGEAGGFSDSYYINCHRIRGCPASMYLVCPVFERGGNCWEAPEKCMDCNKDCESCEVYAKAVALGLAKP